MYILAGFLKYLLKKRYMLRVWKEKRQEKRRKDRRWQEGYDAWVKQGRPYL